MSAKEVLRTTFDGTPLNSTEAPAQSASLENALSAKQPQDASEQVVESAGAEEPSAKEEENREADKYAKGFAALSRKEKAVREREAALQKKEEELEARLSDMEAKLNGYSEFDSRLKDKPLQALQEKGLSLQDLVDLQLNDEQPTPEMQIKALNEKIASIEEKHASELDKFRTEQLEREKSEEQALYDETIQDFKASIEEFVNEKSEDYPLIKAMGHTQLVYDVIEQQHSDTGRILSLEEASKSVETYLEAEISKYKGNEKIAKLLELQATKEEDSTDVKQPVKETVTLSNTHSASVPNRHSRKMSNEESIAEAAKLIRWDAD